MKWKLDTFKYEQRLRNALVYLGAGKITSSIGLTYEALLPDAAVGSLCRIIVNPSFSFKEGIDAEVIGFRNKKVILMPFEEVRGIHKESLVLLKQKIALAPVGRAFLGRVIDARGQPLDGKGTFVWKTGERQWRGLYHRSGNPMERALITQHLDVGIRSINSLLTIGQGQKVGVFSGSGVGKSVLLGMMARATSADVNVLALVGERGREVREFIEKILGPEGMKKSIVVVATSEESALMRLRAAYYAVMIAEYFRDQGKNVLFLMDSLTRFSMAQREIGLSMGEPPATKGYPPTVFAMMPKLLERVGVATQQGSITGIVTVLVEGDELEDPIADAARSVLDGHIVLDRKLANRQHYPAIDVLQSRSRVMIDVTSKEQQKNAAEIIKWLALYREAEEMINIGAYVKGSQPELDIALEHMPRILKFLQQKIDEKVPFQESAHHLRALVSNASS